METKRCKHRYRDVVAREPFDHGVAIAPYTDENRAAHGGSTVKVVCRTCGAERFENRNAGQVEASPWAMARTAPPR